MLAVGRTRRITDKKDCEERKERTKGREAGKGAMGGERKFLRRLLFMTFPDWSARGYIKERTLPRNIIYWISADVLTVQIIEYRRSVPGFSFVFAKWTYGACNISPYKQTNASRCVSIARRHRPSGGAAASTVASRDTCSLAIPGDLRRLRRRYLPRTGQRRRRRVIDSARHAKRRDRQTRT